MSPTSSAAAETGVRTGSPDAPADGRPATAPTGRTLGAAGRARLRREARRVLLGNWTGTSTVPSPGLYPHQWSWDSAFIAVGLRHLSPARAQRELETLLSAQWDDGRVPHIVFNPRVPLDAYFPGPDFWRSSTAGAGAGAPRTAETSGIVQPPVHALAAWLVHEADPAASRRRGFLARVRPRLAAWHRYLADHRDLGGGGLAAVVHPWEPGMDNSPCWDGPLERVTPAPPGSFRRADLAHGTAADRPTDLDYGRYVRLAADYRDHGYRDAEAPHRFAVEDPSFNALFIASGHALAAICTELGDEAEARSHSAHAASLTESLVRRLWSPGAGQFLCRDLRAGPADGDTEAGRAGGRLLDVRSVAGLLPLIAPGLPEDVTAALLRTVTGEHFGLGTKVRLVPSYALDGPAFDPYRYWRGPAWFNVNWLLERGLRRCGETGRADGLRADVLDAAVASRFAEYLDPYSGAGRGTRDFSWTAALALDLLGRPDSSAGRGTEVQRGGFTSMTGPEFTSSESEEGP
ncbi:amylo-alpha-1,6-glucosidase [Streptomyces ovatisporus]|uniref:Amylo-alpha-1,6-glucosidase n=1 Tax=Streptomyces ovatisporus TaxID=1128682 RepID=A0ABV9A148_9ACTN